MVVVVAAAAEAYAATSTAVSLCYSQLTALCCMATSSGVLCFSILSTNYI